MTTTIAELEVAARRLREARDEVAGVVRDLKDDVAALERAAARAIKTAVARTADRQAELFNLIDAGRGLFESPRTQTFHGIKFGLEKGKGKIEFSDKEQVIASIEKKLPDQAEALIKTKKSILKNALKNLSVDDLKRIGCTVEETGDQVVIRFTDREVDKLVNALLKNAVEEAQEEAA